MKSKKAQLFTLIGISLVILFFVSYEVYSIVHERSAIKNRVRTMENFLFSTEANLERQLYISGFRIIFLAESEITRTGSYLEDFNSFFLEAIYNGTVNNNLSSIMIGATISELQEAIGEKASKINADVSFSEISVSLFQQDAWNLGLNFQAEMNFSDNSGLVEWNRKENITSSISIIGFEDPLYLLSTSGKVSRKINQTAYEGNFTLANLDNHLEHKYYSANPQAPSFLDRLQGIKLPNENGIESFVYIPELSSQGISVSEKSCIDYIYFSFSNPSYSSVSGLPDWFKIDDSHKEHYGLA